VNNSVIIILLSQPQILLGKTKEITLVRDNDNTSFDPKIKRV